MGLDKMAEEKKYTPGTRGRVAGGVINTLKVIGNALGGRFHYYRTADLDLVPHKKLKHAVDLLGRRIETLTHVESNYAMVADTIRQAVESVYEELNIYTSEQIIDRERGLLSKGTGVKRELIEIDGKSYAFPIPKTKEIKFPDGYLEEVSYFGYNKKGQWIRVYTKLIGKICKEKIDRINNDGNLTSEQKSNMIAMVDKVIKMSYLGVMQGFFAGLSEEDKKQGRKPSTENISGKEKSFEGYLYKLKEQQYKKISDLRAELSKNMPDNIKYKHTYKVVHPYKYDKDGSIIDQLPNPDRWVDENGKPLEVATKGYKFEGRAYSEGDILLDIFDGITSPRNVHKDFIVDLPLIDVLNYVHCEWDEYRDDLRDGRYHPASLTVMDYIMAANSSTGGKWKSKIYPSLIGPDYRKYKMKLSDGRTITHNREPSNLNPAFDLRAFDREGGEYWQYIGKKKYYGHCDDACVKEQRDPIITTRGLSMFIIETVCRLGKSLEEIQEDLRIIAKQTGGYDYGPRPFGGAFCKDPFDINVGAANESVVKASMVSGPPNKD